MKFVKHRMKNCLENNADVNLALLQIRAMAIGPILPSPATQLFMRPIMGIILTMSRMPINFNYDIDCHHALIEGRNKAGKNNNAVRDKFCIPIGSTVAVQ